jgi:UDP-3-O-[3-hydroxymyristoyl] glucosamine N-acyltransferase
MKLKELADKLGARLEPLDADAEISSVGSIESALPGQITFAVSSKYLPLANASKASALIVDEKFPALEKPTLRTRNPQFAYARAVELLHVLPQEKLGIHPTAVIDPSARIGANASIGACVVIGADVEIGGNCTLMPQVVIYRGVKIGENFFAHAHVSSAKIARSATMCYCIMASLSALTVSASPRMIPASGTRSRKPGAW